MDTSAVNESLASVVDNTLHRFPRKLIFPQRLEEYFNEDTRKERSWHLFIAGFFALLIYNLFLFSDYFMIHDVFKAALLVRLLVISPVMMIGMVIQYRNPRPFVRELVESIAIFLTGLSLIFLLVFSRSPFTTSYHPGIALVLIFSNIVVRVRFWHAVFVSMGIFIIYLLLLPFFYISSWTIEINNLVYFCSTVIISLVGNYRIEKEIRTNYLMALRERIHAMRLHDQNIELAELSSIDPLTGVPNRRSMDSFLERLTGGVGKEFLGVILFDIDNFKQYNDIYGHQEGDDCLKKVAAGINETLRSSRDFIARYGGEEFIVFLPGVDPEEAAHISERIRRHIFSLGITHSKGVQSEKVTLSGGLACGWVAQMPDTALLIQDADEALYTAKREGKNRIVSREFQHGGDTNG